MGVHQHRKRIAGRVPEGGGIDAPSLTDTATDDDIMEHDTGSDPAGVMAVAELDYDETYGPVGVPTDRPTPDPYTLDEARRDMAGYDDAPFGRATFTRNTAQVWDAKTLIFPPHNGVAPDAYLLAGSDPWRKRIIIRNVSLGTAAARDLCVGVDASVNANNGFVLRGGISAGGQVAMGGELVLEHTGDVWIVPAVYGGIAAEQINVSYVIERYAQ